jgi:hypothetical protein
MTLWLAEDPRRGQATWTNHRGTPLLRAADGKRYSPTGLVMHMLGQVGAKMTWKSTQPSLPLTCFLRVLNGATATN